MNSNLIDISADYSLHDPFYIRSDSSADKGALGQILQGGSFDIEEFHQGRVARALYADMIANSKTPIILDLGANIGAGSRFFSLKYPDSAIISVEPDEENAHLCLLNTSAYRAESLTSTVVSAAIGSTNGTLFLADRGLGEWGYQVGSKGEKSVTVLDVPTLLKELPPNASPFIAKIDIEGGEKDLFSRNYFWIYDFAVVILEIHDWLHPFESCTHPLQRVFASQEYDQVFKGENIYYFSYKHLKPYHNPYKAPLFS